MRDRYEQNIYIGDFVALEGLAAQYFLVLDQQDGVFTIDYLTNDAIFMGRHEVSELHARNRNIAVVNEDILSTVIKQKREETLQAYHRENPEAKHRYDVNQFYKKADIGVTQMSKRRRGRNKSGSKQGPCSVMPFPELPKEAPKSSTKSVIEFPRNPKNEPK